VGLEMVGRIRDGRVGLEQRVGLEMVGRVRDRE
jgi:hypothetical protein